MGEKKALKIFLIIIGVLFFIGLIVTSIIMIARLDISDEEIANNEEVENTQSTISEDSILNGEQVIFNKGKIKVTLKDAQITASEEEEYSAILDMNFDVENKSDKNIKVKITELPKINGYTDNTLVSSTGAVKANENGTIQATTRKLSFIKSSEDKIKEISFTIAVMNLDENNREKEVLYIQRNTVIKTKFADNEKIDVIAENKDVGTSIYEGEKVSLRATLTKNGEKAVLRLILINNGLTSPDVVEDRPTADEKFDGVRSLYEIASSYIGELDYIFLKIDGIKINGVELKKGTFSYPQIMTTVANSVSVMEVAISAENESLSDYGIKEIENVEVYGYICLAEMYKNLGNVFGIRIVSNITEFKDVKIEAK